MEVFVEVWLTDDEYERVKDHQQLAWQESPKIAAGAEIPVPVRLLFCGSLTYINSIIFDSRNRRLRMGKTCYGLPIKRKHGHSFVNLFRRMLASVSTLSNNHQVHQAAA